MAYDQLRRPCTRWDRVGRETEPPVQCSTTNFRGRQIMNETYIHPSREQIAAIQDMEVDGPIVMLNLLRFAPNGGAEEYARYGAAAAPFIESSEATIRYLGDVAATVIGGEEWDQVILVEYPSKQAFLDMTGNPDYPSQIRAGALADSRLYCTRAVTGWPAAG